MSSFGSYGVDPGYGAISRGNAYADRASMYDPTKTNSAGQYTIPGQSGFANPRPRARQGLPVIPSPSSLPPATLNSYQQQNQNNGARANVQSAEMDYANSQFNDWYAQRQREMAKTPIPSSPSSIYPPAPGQPGPPNQIPGPSMHMTNARGQTFYGNPIPSAPQSGPPSPMIPPQSASQLPAFNRLTPNEQHFNANTSATGTLKGSFQAHDAAGNAIPGQYNSVDASAPRDLANLQANARANARVSSEFNQELHGDPGFQQAQQNVADVKAATNAGKPYTAPGAESSKPSNIPPGIDPADWQQLKPAERVKAVMAAKAQGFRETQATNKADLAKDAGFRKFIAGTLDQWGSSFNRGALRVTQWFKQVGENGEKFAALDEKRKEAAAKNSPQAVWNDIFKDMTKKRAAPEDIEAAHTLWKHYYQPDQTTPTTTPPDQPSPTDAPAPSSPAPQTPNQTTSGQNAVASQIEAKGGRPLDLVNPPLTFNGVEFKNNGDGTVTHPDGRKYKVDGGKIVARVQ